MTQDTLKLLLKYLQTPRKGLEHRGSVEEGEESWLKSPIKAGAELLGVNSNDIFKKLGDLSTKNKKTLLVSLHLGCFYLLSKVASDVTDYKGLEKNFDRNAQIWSRVLSTTPSLKDVSANQGPIKDLGFKTLGFLRAFYSNELPKLKNDRVAVQKLLEEAVEVEGFYKDFVAGMVSALLES